MEQNEKLQKVMQKLRKLQKLYEGAKEINSEGEAQAAAAAIQRILEEYNITLEEVGETVNPDAICEEKISGYNGKTHGGDWVQKLTSVICRHNFCRCYYYGRGNKTLLIAGKKENIEVVKWLRDMLMEKYVKLGVQRYKEYILKNAQMLELLGKKPERKNPFLRRYLIGCAAGLEYKLKMEETMMKNKDEQRDAKVTALVVQNENAVMEYMKGKYGYIGSVKHRQLSWTNASEQGFNDGKNTELHKPIQQSRETQINNVKLLG